MTGKHIVIQIQVLPDTPEAATRAVDSLNRVLLGLAFDGITANITLAEYEVEEEDEDVDT